MLQLHYRFCQHKKRYESEYNDFTLYSQVTVYQHLGRQILLHIAKFNNVLVGESGQVVTNQTGGIVPVYTEQVNTNKQVLMS